MKKITVGLLFGGLSCEHEISVRSAQSILRELDKDKFEVCLIGIDPAGRWSAGESMDELLNGEKVKTVADADCVTIAAHQQGNLIYTNRSDKQLPKIDVIFPALHGSFGEDGTVQGLFELAKIPYVGCGVAASAVAMDKLLAKKVFAAAGLPQVEYLKCTAADLKQDAILNRAQELGLPLFVKPSNMGSSVGIRQVKSRVELISAVEYALRFDTAVVIERGLSGWREMECAVLGNHDARASPLGEIIPSGEFYDYAAKYIDATSKLIVPAELPDDVTARVQKLSLAAFHCIGGSGLARVDFFVSSDGEIMLNEINTLPGFTTISMYPRLWQAGGIAYKELISRLIDYALQRSREMNSLQREFADQ